jgi:hypothetical protein
MNHVLIACAILAAAQIIRLVNRIEQRHVWRNQ